MRAVCRSILQGLSSTQASDGEIAHAARKRVCCALFIELLSVITDGTRRCIVSALRTVETLRETFSVSGPLSRASPSHFHLCVYVGDTHTMLIWRTTD